MRLLILSILFLSVSFSSFCQDLTGTWEGSADGEYAKICIVRYNNTYVGFTYDEGMGYCKCHFLGEYDPQTKKLKGVNKGVIEKTFFHVQSRYNLNYVVINGQEFLKGTIAPKVGIMAIPSGITYTRTSPHVDTTDFMLTWLRENVQEPRGEVAKQKPVIYENQSPRDRDPLNTIAQQPVPVEKTTPVLIKTDSAKTIAPPPVVTPTPAPVPKVTTAENIIIEKNKRVNDTLSVINTNATELVIKVMDNGVVDGDTVSIIHNGRVIAERISVKAAAHEIKIPINGQNKRQEIVLVAHNLGSIPPNTALIIIETPDKQYRVTASTDLSKNAMIIFQYKE